VVLRHQLAVLRRQIPRPRLEPAGRPCSLGLQAPDSLARPTIPREDHGGMVHQRDCSAVCFTSTGQLHERVCAPSRRPGSRLASMDRAAYTDDGARRRSTGAGRESRYVPGVPSAILQAHKSPPGRLQGGLFGGGYWGSSGRTLAAWGPFGPDVTSNSTACPSSSER
jgi:hypothetical protein